MQHLKRKESKKNQKNHEDEHQKWFDRDDLQDLAKFGGDILKKTVATSMDVIKEVKENFPKEATQFITKSKDELLKGLTQEMAKNILSFSIEKFFSIARQHHIEFSVRIKHNDENINKDKIENRKKQK